MKDVAAERGILSGVYCYGNEIFTDICDIIKADTFTVDSNQVIWKCFEKILNDNENGKPDFPSVLSAAKSLGFGEYFNKSGEVDYFRSITNMPIDKSNVRKLAAKIRKLEITREIYRVHERIRENLELVTGDESVDEILSKSETPVMDYAAKIADPSSSGPELIGNGSLEYYNFLLDNPRELMGISSGFPIFDRIIGGGLRENGVDLIAARQKSGKSMIASNIALNVSKQNVPTLVLDTEMMKKEHQIRIAGNLGNILSKEVEKGQKEHRETLINVAKQLSKIPYYFESIIGLSPDEVISKMRRWVMKTVGLGLNGKAKPCLIILDYLKLQDFRDLRNNLAEHQLLGQLASNLKNFAGHYGISCLSFAQLNRQGIEEETSAVIRGSDKILDVVTSFNIFKVKTEDERAEGIGNTRKYSHKLISVFSRFGEPLEAGDYVNYEAIYSKGIVREGPTRNMMANNEKQGFVVEGGKEIEF